MTLSFIGMRSNTNSWTLQCNNLIPHSGVSFLFPIELELCVAACEWLRGRCGERYWREIDDVKSDILINFTSVASGGHVPCSVEQWRICKSSYCWNFLLRLQRVISSVVPPCLCRYMSSSIREPGGDWKLKSPPCFLSAHSEITSAPNIFLHLIRFSKMSICF